MRNHPGGGKVPELVEVLDKCAAQSGNAAAGFGVPKHTLCALGMLEMAVEWRIPAVERWAVAWLAATGETQLRLRWSSRARDGRSRREAQASDQIVSVAGVAGQVVLGLASGAVETWSMDGALRPCLTSAGWPVWALAARADQIAATGPRNGFQSRGIRPGPPPPDAPRSGQKAAAIGPAGQEVAIGDDHGRIRIWIPGQGWRMAYEGGAGQALALAFAATPGLSIRAVWASGDIAELAVADWPGNWSSLGSLGSAATTAAWNESGTLLAAVVGDYVWLVGPKTGRSHQAPLWKQPGAQALAWSPSGVLASASLDQIFVSAAPVTPSGQEQPYQAITCDEQIDQIAFLDDDHVVTVRSDRLIQWDISSLGSNDPTFLAGDPITAIGIRAGDRRMTLVGTKRGRLQEYSATGVLLGEIRLPRMPQVRQLAWYSEGSYWLVASPDGVYRYKPREAGRDGQVVHLVPGPYRHVAAGGRRFAYATNHYIVTSEERRIPLPSRLMDLQISPDGELAAMVMDGRVLMQRAGEEPRWSPARPKPGARLLDYTGRQLVRDPAGRISLTGPRGASGFRQLPPGVSDAVSYDADQVVAAYRNRGILLARTGTPRTAWAPARPHALETAAGRIVVAAPNYLAGYDVLDQVPATADGFIPVQVSAHARGGRVTFPSGRSVTLSQSVLNLASSPAWAADTRVDELSDAVFQTGRIGDLIWQGGLDLEIDRARGPDPNRPVCIEWRCDELVEQFPWELLHPAGASLGWFDDPPVTAVRRVTPARPAARPAGPRLGTPTMLAVRSRARGLEAVDEAFDRFRRRTRRTDVRLLSHAPTAVESIAELASALGRPVDILQLWAHSDDRGVQLTADREAPLILVADLAGLIARRPPRLVILVGCRSGALGRALVTHGITAALAMRVPVQNHTIQPLVEDVTAGVLTGTRIDLAFAAALRRYLLTGQPGAAAVPMLYLADQADGVLFPERGSGRPERSSNAR